MTTIDLHTVIITIVKNTEDKLKYISRNVYLWNEIFIVARSNMTRFVRTDIRDSKNK